MATRLKRLTTRQVETLGPGFHADGGSLYLRVRPSGSRAWVFRYTRDSRVREIGLGPTHTRDLVGVRDLARLMRQAVTDREDPASVLRAEVETPADVVTFESCALDLIESKKAGWRNAKHAQQWRNTLSTYVYPKIGKKHPSEVSLADVKAILSPIWKDKTETATRVRQRVESVLDWATVHEHRSGENPARWRGVLDKIFPQPSSLKAVQHFTAMPYGEVPALMTVLRGKTSISAYCLRFVILTATRSSEARGARWDEIDLTKREWTVPPERMKKNRPHRIPLTDEAVDLLNNMPRIEGQELVFPGLRGGVMSDVALSKALHSVRLGFTVHGFRSSFREWAAEQTNFPAAVCELALAHVNKDKVEAAYQRSDLFERRRELMSEWSAFL